jgi:microcystin-dependent protein
MADIAAVNWNETDSANTAAAPDGSPEGMMSSGVNNVLRAHQGAIKRFWKRNSVKVTTGTAGAYLVTHTVPPAALADGECELIQFHAANTAGATLNVGGLGAVPLHYFAAGAWRLIPNDLWGADFTSRVAYNAAAAAYRLLDLPDRTGEVVTFAGATAPHGSLLCYGQAISRTAYAGLFAALGTAHGVGDGTATFNLPDLRGRVAAGLGNMGGTESGRLNSYVASVLGAVGGAQSNDGVGVSVSGTLSGSVSGTLTGGYAGGELADAAGNSIGRFLTSLSVINTGGTLTGSMGGTLTGATGAFALVQPTLALNSIVRI